MFLNTEGTGSCGHILTLIVKEIKSLNAYYQFQNFRKRINLMNFEHSRKTQALQENRAHFSCSPSFQDVRLLFRLKQVWFYFSEWGKNLNCMPPDGRTTHSETLLSVKRTGFGVRGPRAGAGDSATLLLRSIVTFSFCLKTPALLLLLLLLRLF